MFLFIHHAILYPNNMLIIYMYELMLTWTHTHSRVLGRILHQQTFTEYNRSYHYIYIAISNLHKEDKYIQHNI